MNNRLHNKTKLFLGKCYTRQKIRIGLCKMMATGKVIDYMADLERLGYLRLENKSPMHSNLDMFTIIKDFTE